MSSDEVFRLESGPLRLEIDPSLGGSITSFRYVAGGTRLPVLRDAKPGYASVLESSSFPLVPYSNRIRGGRFVFRGREVTVAPNVPTDPSPLHGQGWMSPWRVERASPAQAELVFRHPAGEWPWDYEARQHFTLDDGGLGIRLSCRNLSGEPMPCGLGQHPYFPCTGETRLDTEVEGVWTIDADVLPIERVPASGRYDLRDRPVCGQDLVPDRAVVAGRGLLPALFAALRGAVRRRARHAHQRRAERARGGVGAARPQGAGAGRGDEPRRPDRRHLSRLGSFAPRRRRRPARPT
jgi:aldose 1-epimerase